MSYFFQQSPVAIVTLVFFIGVLSLIYGFLQLKNNDSSTTNSTSQVEVEKITYKILDLHIITDTVNTVTASLENATQGKSQIENVTGQTHQDITFTHGHVSPEDVTTVVTTQVIEVTTTPISSGKGNWTIQNI